MSSKLFSLLVGLTLTTSTLSGAELRAIVPEKHLDLMFDYCMDCHNADTQKGKVNLEDLPLEVDTLQHAELWQKVLDVLNSGEMPPENKKQPESVAKADFLEDLAKTMVLARKKLSDSGGQITMRRLNRREYQNTIKSLTGVSLNVESLPADGGAGSFDTVGASQFISSDQFEQYLELGRTAVDEAFARHSAMAKPSTVFRVEPEKTVNVEHLEMIKKMEERLAHVKPWMDSVDKAVKAPENEAIMAQLRQEHPDIDTHAFRIYRMSNRLKGVMELKHFGGDPDSAMNFYQLDYRTKYESLKYFAELPHNERGTYLRYTSGIVRLDIPSPKERSKLVPGKYKVRFKAGIVEGTPIERHFIEVGHPRRTSPVPSGFSNPPLSVHQVTGTIENPQVIESIVEVSIDGPKEFGIQERMPKDFKARMQKHHADRRKNGHGTPPALWVDWIELEGPIQDGAVQTFRVEPEKTVNVMSANWMKRLEEAHQRFLGWKAGVDKAALVPENQQALEQIRKKYNITDLTNSIRLYQNADLLKGIPDAKNFGFKDSNDASFSFRGGYDRMYAYQKHYAELPLSDRGTYLKLGWGFQRIVISPPADKLAPGEYKLRIRSGSVIGSDPNRHFIQIGYPQRNNDVPAGFAGKPISGHQVNGTTENPEIIETIVKIGSGNPNEFAIQERQPEDRDTYRKQFYRIKKENGYGYPPAVWIDWAELEGPIRDKQIIESSITRVEPEKTINPANEKIIKKAEATQDRFKQWKKGVDEAAKSPENQAIIAEIRKKNRLIDHPNRFYIFAEHFKNVPNPKDFGFLDFQKAAAADPSRSKNLALLKHYASLPHRDTGTYLKLTHGTGRVIVAPKKMPVGDYVFRVRLGTVKGTPAARKFIEIGHPQRDIESRDWGLKGKPISVHQVTGTIEAPQIMEIPIEVRSDTTREFAVQEKQPNNANLKALWKEHNQFKAENGYGHPPAIWIDWAEIEGPIDSNRPEMFKQRREVEKYATAKVKRKYESYFKAGYDAALAFQKDGIPRPAVGVKDLDEAKFRIRRYEMEAPSQLRYLNDPLTKTGSLLGVFDRNGNLNSEEFIEISMDPLGFKKKSKPLPLGKYRVRVRMGSVEGTSSDRHFAVLGAVKQGESRNVDGDGFSLLETFQVTGTTNDPQVFETTVELTLNGSRKFSLREKSNLKADTLRGKREIYKNGMAAPPALWIDWVEWEGPLQDKVQDDGLVSILQNNLSGTVDTEEERARSIFQRFCVEAFRQVDPDPMFIDQLVGLYKRRMTAGDSFDVAIRTPLSVILASPGFLYLDEPNIERSKRPLNDRELAVRLAYFLWSSPPDARLFALAKRNELSNPATLRAEVDRMIADPGSEEFVAGFVHQWLHMERLDFFQFDTKLHREFDESVRASARKEVYESFALLMRDPDEGRLGKLLKTDYVMINGLLGTYYGIDGVNGDHFRKVSLPPDSPRGGLLGTAAVLAMGSDGIESSPVERGAWVLRYLLNDPPPPAPPNVPQLSRLADKPLTARERVLAHQEEPQCASCHRKIDPIGFGLENFTAAGKWRTEDKHGKKTYDIDPSGRFHKGPEFSDYFEMRDLIAQKENDFARGFTEHLIGYGLGRPFGFTDEDLAVGILASAKKEDFSVIEFIHALVQSKAFSTK